MKKEKAGQFPYTRGLYENMYKEKLWTMRQYAGYTSAEESNKRYRYLLENGVMGLSVAFDLPTQIALLLQEVLSIQAQVRIQCLQMLAVDQS